MFSALCHGHRLRFTAFLLLLPTLALAQQAKVLAPHDSVAPRMKKPTPLPVANAMSSMVGGPWIVDANFKSTVYLKNVVETSPITVTPVLHLSNAVQYVLPVVTLAPSGTGTVDINAALQGLGIAPFATLSGYLELQYQWPWVPLCAFIRDVDVAHSVIFTFGVQGAGTSLSPIQPSASQVTEGLWWKQEANVTGFLTLANISTQPITAVVQISDDHAAVLGTQTITVSPQGMKTLNLQELLTAPTNQGGLRISYVGQQGTLLINGGLEDTSVGYSANIYFSADPINLPSQAKLMPQNGVAELGLMVGAADPMMHFPAGTTFTPYSVLRNVSSSPVSITPTLWWMQNGAPVSAPLQPLRLAPFETRSLNMPSLLAAAGLSNFSGSVNLVFDYTAKSGLLLAAGSVDQTNTYVFEVAPRVIGKSAGKSVSYWSTANGDDTMITIWNPADEAQDFTFRIEFTGGHYLLPLHLEARATRTFNISEIIQTQVPDAEGNIIPAAIQNGSAKLIGSQADNQHILAAMDGGIYNVVKATCGGYCMGCDGATSYYAIYDGFYVPIGNYESESFMTQWDTGAQYNLTNQSSWNSSNTSVATVQSGSVHGIAGGKFVIAVGDSGEPDYVPYQCFGQPFNCAFAEGGGSSASGTVVSITSVDDLTYGTSGTFNIYGSGFSSLTGTLNITFDDPAITASGTVISDGQIQATYTVPCSSTVGTHNVSVTSGGADGGSGPGATGPVDVVLPNAPTPTIMFGGHSINGTTQSVMVGQQIALGSSFSLPNCMSLSGQQWSNPPGTAVGGYSASSSSGSVTALPANTNSGYTFYWASSGNSMNMNYQYTMSGGGTSASSPVATATFNVGAPQPIVVNTITGAWQIFNNTLSYGNPTPGATHGILFTLTPPSGYGGSYQWVQVINNATQHVTQNGQNFTCGPASGLDTTYPYSTSNPVGDSPDLNFPAGATYEQDSIDATMYLMWNPGLPSSIFVPIGYVHWTATGTAVYSGSTWSIDTQHSSPPSGSSPSFLNSTSYPTWTVNVLNNQGSCQ